MEMSWILFGVAMTLGASACVCYYLVLWRLAKKGIRVKFLATPRDTLRVFSQYRELAAENRWALWPISCFWLFSLLCIMCMAALPYVNSSRFSNHGLTAPHWLSTRATLLWVLATSLIIALVFSYRVLRHISWQKTKLPSWKALVSEEFVRNDLTVAALGWVGFLATLVLTMRYIL